MEWMNTDVDVSRSRFVRKVGDATVTRIGQDEVHSRWRRVQLVAECNGVEISLSCHGIWPDCDVEADRRAALFAHKMQRIAALMEEP
jgi:hypothetical protein